MIDECRSILDSDDIDAWIAYYMFVNHGTLPHEIADMEPREKAFVFAMAEKEIKSRPK